MRVFILAVILFAARTIAAASTLVPDDPTIKLSGTTMGPIPFSVTIANPPKELIEAEAETAVKDALESINRLMSTYRPDSDVSRFNKSESTDWFSVDPETVRVVTRSIEISKLSNGAFDMTVAPAVNRWNFGPGKSDSDFVAPDAKEVAEIKSRVGFQNVEVRLDPPALKKINTAFEYRSFRDRKGLCG